MNFKVMAKRMYLLSTLIIAAMACVATSKSTVNLSQGTFRVSSDCVNPVRDQVAITVSDFEITEPSGLTYQDFGFPETSLAGTTTIGIVDGKSRMCEQTYGDEDGNSDVLIFSCYDSGEFTCSILMEQ